MNALKAARKLIDQAPASDSARTLARMVVSLETMEPFELGRLYALDRDAFRLALDVLAEWRSGKSATGIARLFNLAAEVNRMSLS